jgi:hypothetical protein
MKVHLDDEVQRLGEALGRPIRSEHRWGDWLVVQRCLVCDEEVLTTIDDAEIDRAKLHARLFGHYDGHRCAREINVVFGSDEELDALYARTESESLRLAERAQDLAARGDELATRVERESDLLAVWARWLSREATERSA